MKKILFISHEASRSGAPLILLQFIKWLKKNHPEIKIDILVLRGGELTQEFKTIADYFYGLPKPPGIIKKIMNKVLRIKESSIAIFGETRKIKLEKYNFIYANSLLSIRFASELKRNRKKSGVKYIAHIHELETVIQLILPDLKTYITDFNSIIVPANIVKHNLINNHEVTTEKIKVIREYSEVPHSENLRKNVNKNFVVGASGTVHWRKGPDIFLLVAAYVKKNYPDYSIEFRWVGKLPLSQRDILESDIKKLEISDSVIFTGELSEPIEEYLEFDLFLLPSREDPFPLVCIEAGMLGKPIICFDKATGTAEILEKGGGSIVNYLDVEAMGEKLVEYYRQLNMRENHGRQARELFSDFVPEIICPKIFKVLTE